MWEKLKPYVISILIAVGVGALSAFLTRENMQIYQEIETPPLAPPGFLFPIVWTILYVLMGIGSVLIYTYKDEAYDATMHALFVYGVQLFFNFAWSLIFFNLQNYLLAFLWLLFLWIAIIIMIIRFSKVDPLAAILQIPYLLWVTFAGYLNLMIFLLN